MMATRPRVRMLDIDGRAICPPLTPDELDEWREIVSTMGDDGPCASPYDVRRFLATFDQVMAADKPLEGTKRYRLIDSSGMPVVTGSDGTLDMPTNGVYWLRVVDG